ncbi:hypothetical protein [Pantoea stewartii]|uniref:hypothetical protein n=1 Tax=Pantoea stewartii TaxID=66269 RepID=UPI0025A17BAB|nr:hypothetical protein [Pantoea stewartii]
MSYERQDSTSRLQLYRERKIARMEAMRRAVDEGRTTVVSSASASEDESPVRDALENYVERFKTEPATRHQTASAKSLSNFLHGRDAQSGYIDGIRNIPIPITVSLINGQLTAQVMNICATNDKFAACFYQDLLGSVEDIKKDGLYYSLKSHYTYRLPSFPNPTAESVTKALHEKDIIEDYASRAVVIDTRRFIDSINAQIFVHTLGSQESSEDSLSAFQSYYSTHNEQFMKVPKKTLSGITGDNFGLPNRRGSNNWNFTHFPHNKKY